MRDRTILLDINSDIYKILKYKQFDNNNSLKIVVKDNNKDVDITRYQITSYFKLPKGNVLSKECSIINTNTIEIMITSDILSQNGMTSLEVTLSNENQIVTLFRICLSVEKSINRDESIILPEQMDVASEIENIKTTYATKEYVDEQINNIDFGDIDIGDIDLSNYVTKEELNEVDIQVEKNVNDINKILEIIDEPPIYNNPTLNISATPLNVEHNTQTNITIVPKFTQNDAGGVVSYSLSKNGIEIYSDTKTSTYIDTLILPHGSSALYKATVSYNDGVIKNTLLGIEYPSTSIKAGSISNNTTVKSYALSYYGVIDSNSLDNIEGLTSVLRTSKGSTLTFNMVNQHIVYMYPKSFGNLTSIKDANNFDYINSYTLNNIVLNNVDYNVYILTDAVTINGFKQIFN